MLSRRNFLAASAALLVAGCGSDGEVLGPALDPVPQSDFPTLSGRVNLAELGAGPFEVWSPFGESAPVRNGDFTTVTSPEGVQLHVLFDGVGEMRAFSLGQPGRPLTFDARETALGLLFLIPGILATDFTVAAERAAELEVSELEALLRPSLALRSIRELLSDPAVQQALQRAVEAWLNSRQARLEPGGPSGLTLEPDRLVNQSFRFASSWRELVDAEGQVVEQLALGGLPIALPGAVHNLYTLEGEPSPYPVPPVPPGLRARYWIYGLGSDQPPPPAAPPVPPPNSNTVGPAYMVHLTALAELLSGQSQEQRLDILIEQINQAQSQQLANEALEEAQREAQANQASGIAKAFAALTAVAQVLLAHYLRDLNPALARSFLLGAVISELAVLAPALVEPLVRYLSRFAPVSLLEEPA